jgi:hypothetical protein
MAEAYDASWKDVIALQLVRCSCAVLMVVALERRKSRLLQSRQVFLIITCLEVSNHLHSRVSRWASTIRPVSKAFIYTMWIGWPSVKLSFLGLYLLHRLLESGSRVTNRIIVVYIHGILFYLCARVTLRKMLSSMFRYFNCKKQRSSYMAFVQAYAGYPWGVLGVLII